LEALVAMRRIRNAQTAGANPVLGSTFALEALLAMRRTCNAQIAGSIPVFGSTFHGKEVPQLVLRQDDA
jgi:hypothetical protein